MLHASVEMPTNFDVVASGPAIITPGCVLIRRKVAEKIGGFDQRLAPAEDWDYWARLCRIAPMRFVDISTIRYRQHSLNNSSNRKKAVKAVQRVRHRLMYSPDSSVNQQRIAVGAYRAFYRMMALARGKSLASAIGHGRFRNAVQDGKLASANALMSLVGPWFNYWFFA